MQVLSIILAILAFGVLVIVHEFGHFITAKRGGVQVNEFWIGMGPTVLKHEYHGTMYCLKLLPFGGACVMEGEDGESESEHAFGRARLRRRILIVAAGALMNFLIGFVILLFAVQAPSENGFITTTVASISEGSSVLEGGLQEGDTVAYLQTSSSSDSMDFMAVGMIPSGGGEMPGGGMPSGGPGGF